MKPSVTRFVDSILEGDLIQFPGQGPEPETTRLNRYGNSLEVLARRRGDELVPIGYGNRSQAKAKADMLGADKWVVWQGMGRAFYVAKADQWDEQGMLRSGAKPLAVPASMVPERDLPRGYETQRAPGVPERDLTPALAAIQAEMDWPSPPRVVADHGDFALVASPAPMERTFTVEIDKRGNYRRKSIRKDDPGS